MEQSLFPLSSICHCWRCQLIPTAFAALQRGIARESERFRQKPFVLLSLLHEYDYDGLVDYIELIEGFADADTATLNARRQAEAALSRALAEPCYGNYNWRQVETKWPIFFARDQISRKIRSIFAERFKVENGSGFDAIYFEFEVLHVTTPDVIGQELFCFIDAESEWTRFLIDRGKSENVV